MKRFRKLLSIAVILALLCGLAPLNARAALFEIEFKQNLSNIGVGDVVKLSPTVKPTDVKGVKFTYSSSDTNVASVSTSGSVTARKAGTVTIYVTGKHEEDEVETSVDIEILKKLTATTSPSLLNRRPGESFNFQVSFNAPKNDVTYSFRSFDDSIATIDEDTGRIVIKSVGTTTIELEASADGFKDLVQEFTLTATSGTSTNTNTNNNTTNDDTTNDATTTGTTTPSNPEDARFKGLKFTGKISVEGVEFSTTNNFSAGTQFAIKTGDNNGDWWRSPQVFTGSRGVYTANNEGVNELIYADTTGKIFNFIINTHKLVKKNKFMIPERIPVGAIFSIPAPVDKPGIWVKNSKMLSGSRGTYIPLQAGSTRLEYVTRDLRHGVILNIVDDTPAAAPDDPAAINAGAVNSDNSGIENNPAPETSAQTPAAPSATPTTPSAPSSIVLN